MTTGSLSEIDFRNNDSAVDPGPTGRARPRRPTPIDLTFSCGVA
jgi:hypothetical protein